MLGNALAMKGLSNDERLRYQNEFSLKRKEKTTGFLLAFALGDFGAHRFYLGETGLGVLYLIFFWTLIPCLIGIIEAVFLMSRRVQRYNENLSNEIIISIIAMREP